MLVDNYSKGPILHFLASKVKLIVLFRGCKQILPSKLCFRIHAQPQRTKLGNGTCFSGASLHLDTKVKLVISRDKVLKVKKHDYLII